jgi:hypothetical protein
VLAVVKAFNAKAFFRKSIVFLSYDTPKLGGPSGEGRATDLGVNDTTEIYRLV